MKTHFQFFEDEKLLIVNYTGDFSIEEYSQNVNEVTKRAEWSFVEKILVDIRKTKFNIPIQKIEEIIDIKKNKLNPTKLITVHLVDSPYVTAVSHLYQTHLKQKEFNLNYCSTILKAKELLNLTNSVEDLKLKLNSLKS